MAFQLSKTLRKFNRITPKQDAFVSDNSEKESSMLMLDGNIGIDQKIDVVNKNIGQRFNFDQSAEAILQQTTDLEIQNQTIGLTLATTNRSYSSNHSRRAESLTRPVTAALPKCLKTAHSKSILTHQGAIHFGKSRWVAMARSASRVPLCK